MDQEKKYRVLILPTIRVAAIDLTLTEAAAWIGSYNHIMVDQPLYAVISEEK